MPIDPLIIWKTEFENLNKQLPMPASIQNLADYVDQRVSMKMQFAPPVLGSPPIFIFSKALFAAQLLSLSASAPTGAPVMAQAFETAVLASTMTPGTTFVGAPAPPTLFAGPPVALPNPALVTVASALLMSMLASAPPTGLPMTSMVPDALYAAFSALGYILTGINSLPPPAGPEPLIIPTTVL